jgi:hypothetical protein
MRGITGLIQQAIIDKLVSEVGEHLNDEARLSRVVRNALQDDPTGDCSAEVYHQQPGESSWRDELHPTHPFEIGGGKFWIRRFSVHVNGFLEHLGLERDDASEVFSLLLSRIVDALSKEPYVEPDQRGERLVHLNDIVIFSSARGGPDTSWIYDAWIRLEYVTFAP